MKPLPEQSCHVLVGRADLAEALVTIKEGQPARIPGFKTLGGPDDLERL